MAFLAFLAYLILGGVHGYEIFETTDKQWEQHDEAKADKNVNNNNFKLKEKKSDMDTLNNKQLAEVQQSPELTVKNPSKKHLSFF